MKRTVLHGLICVLSFWLPSLGAIAQETFSVRLSNKNYSVIYVTAYDHICKRSVYHGQMAYHTSREIKVCRDLNGNAVVTVYDRRGRRVTYYDLARGALISVSFDLSLSRGR